MHLFTIVLKCIYRRSSEQYGNYSKMASTQKTLFLIIVLVVKNKICDLICSCFLKKWYLVLLIHNSLCMCVGDEDLGSRA